VIIGSLCSASNNSLQDQVRSSLGDAKTVGAGAIRPDTAAGLAFLRVVGWLDYDSAEATGRLLIMATIGGKHPILFKAVFEVRYRLGYLFLDRCGRVMNTILEEHPEWVFASQPNPQGASFLSLRNSATFNFSSEHFVLALEKATGNEGLDEGDFDVFSEQAEALSGLVQEYLDLKEFSRIGLRIWYLFSCDSKAESEDWLRGLGYFSVPDRLYEAFSGQRDAAGASIVIATDDRRFRITLNSVERSAQIDLGDSVLNVPAHSLSKDQDKILREQLKRKARRVRQDPGFAVMVDVDVFSDEKSDECDAKDFIETSRNGLLERLRKAATRGPEPS
jgi:hypothetical protein